MLKKRILYFGSFALTLLCAFYAMQLKTYAATDHYKKVDKSYVLEKVDGYNSYHEAYSICDSSTGELINMDDYPTGGGDPLTSAYNEGKIKLCVSKNSDENKKQDSSVFPQKFSFDMGYELESIFVYGSECTKAFQESGVHTQGCSQVKNTFKNVYAVDSNGAKSYSLPDLNGVSFEVGIDDVSLKTYTKNLVVFGYNSQKTELTDDGDGSEKYACMDSGGAVPCNSPLYWYMQSYNDLKYSSLESENDPSKITRTFDNYYRGTNSVDKFYSTSSEKGSYVCIAAMIYDPGSGKKNQLASLAGTYGAMNLYYSYSILVNSGSSPQEVLDNCKKVFPQKIADYQNMYDNNYKKWLYNNVMGETYHSSTSDATTPFDVLPDYAYDLQVYSVSEFSQSVSKFNISNDSIGMECSWNIDNNGEKAVASTKFYVSLAGDYGFTGFGNFVNVGEFSPAVELTPNEIENMLNKNDSLKNLFANSITSEAPPDPLAGTKVAIVVGSVLVMAFLTVTTFGAGAAIGVSVIAGFAFKTAVTLAATGGLIFLTDIGSSVINAVETMTGTLKSKAWLFYKNGNTNSSKKVDGAKCVYTKFSPESDIKKYNQKVTCEDLFYNSNGTKTSFYKILEYVFKIVRIVAVSLLVLFSVMDFVKPIVSGDADTLNKSTGKFVKRLIVFVLIMFVPSLVELLLSLIGKSSCNLG